MKRHIVSKKSGGKLFTRTAHKVHPKNAVLGGPVMRGGIRM